MLHNRRAQHRLPCPWIAIEPQNSPLAVPPNLKFLHIKQPVTGPRLMLLPRRIMIRAWIGAPQPLGNPFSVSADFQAVNLRPNFADGLARRIVHVSTISCEREHEGTFVLL